MLHSQNFQNVRLWPRGVDLSQFGSHRRSTKLRASWQVGPAPNSALPSTSKATPARSIDAGTHWQGRKASLGLPMTPPMTPEVYAAGGVVAEPQPAIEETLAERVVLLYVGRM